MAGIIASSLNAHVLRNTLAKLGTKLKRQEESVAETQQHIAAIQSLVEAAEKADAQLKGNK